MNCFISLYSNIFSFFSIFFLYPLFHLSFHSQRKIYTLQPPMKSWFYSFCFPFWSLLCLLHQQLALYPMRDFNFCVSGHNDDHFCHPSFMQSNSLTLYLVIVLALFSQIWCTRMCEKGFNIGLFHLLLFLGTPVTTITWTSPGCPVGWSEAHGLDIPLPWWRINS